MSDTIVDLQGIVDGVDLRGKKVRMIGVNRAGPELINCLIDGMEIIESIYGHVIDCTCIGRIKGDELPEIQEAVYEYDEVM